METKENKGSEEQARSRNASIMNENLSDEGNQEESESARKIRKIRHRKINEEQPTLMKFAEGAPVAEETAGERIMTTRNGGEAIKVMAYTPRGVYGGYQSLVAPFIQRNPAEIQRIIQMNMNKFSKKEAMNREYEVGHTISKTASQKTAA
ncbi:hypothetical protein DSO57_1019695 [Entomophthora muscae]|uniref:Uncharacterized protein n=1 Tax=Entomophthora muscae TaxID=34485 RepID=A0ACC2RV96_9FUNG|nr:hypothetical protein DSO57_1019695 [Entomophthora muscae]